jgi:hypothetical protein
MSEEKLREKFRAWMLSDGFPEVVLKEDGEGEFCYGYTHNMWEAFQAGASLSTEERGEVVYEGRIEAEQDWEWSGGVKKSRPFACIEVCHRALPLDLAGKKVHVTIRRPKEEG